MTSEVQFEFHFFFFSPTHLKGLNESSENVGMQRKYAQYSVEVFVDCFNKNFGFLCFLEFTVALKDNINVNGRKKNVREKGRNCCCK